MSNETKPEPQKLNPQAVNQPDDAAKNPAVIKADLKPPRKDFKSLETKLAVASAKRDPEALNAILDEIKSYRTGNLTEDEKRELDSLHSRVDGHLQMATTHIKEPQEQPATPNEQDRKVETAPKSKMGDLSSESFDSSLKEAIDSKDPAKIAELEKQLHTKKAELLSDAQTKEEEFQELNTMFDKLTPYVRH